jgi:hypothetical protein
MNAPAGRDEKKMQRFAERRARLADLGYDIAPMAGKSLDDNDVRTILAAIVRRWTTTVEVVYQSEAVWAGSPSHLEHVVPVRLLVDRMIQFPRTSKRLLRTCVVVARITPAEHRKIGSLVGANAALYETMKSKKCTIDDIVGVAWGRYTDHAIKVTDEKGRTPPIKSDSSCARGRGASWSDGDVPELTPRAGLRNRLRACV